MDVPPFYSVSPHPVRVHALGDVDASSPIVAVKLPTDLCRAFGELTENIVIELDVRDFFGVGVRALSGLVYELQPVSPEDQVKFREFFGECVPIIAVSLPVKQALMRMFQGRPTPEQMGEFLMGKPARRVHVVVPYTGRHHGMSSHVVYRDGPNGVGKVVYSTSAVEYVTSM